MAQYSGASAPRQNRSATHVSAATCLRDGRLRVRRACNRPGARSAGDPREQDGHAAYQGRHEPRKPQRANRAPSICQRGGKPPFVGSPSWTDVQDLTEAHLHAQPPHNHRRFSSAREPTHIHTTPRPPPSQRERHIAIGHFPQATSHTDIPLPRRDMRVPAPFWCSRNSRTSPRYTFSLGTGPPRCCGAGPLAGVLDAMPVAGRPEKAISLAWSFRLILNNTLYHT